MLRVRPPMIVKSPPTKILPSACTAIDMDRPGRIRVEDGIERAVCIQARDVVAAEAKYAGEIAADKNPAVRLHGGRKT